MSQLEVYFPNHSRALKFPWSLYHKPLLESLIDFLKNSKEGQEVLVVGPGAFQEFSLLKQRGLKISILDIDPRVLKLHEEEYSQEIENYYLVDENFNGYPLEEKFDFIYAKEVIEHLVEYEIFIKKLHSCLRPDGSIWLSTPDYGFFLLPLLEKTLLELVARFSGFSRKDIHPSKFNFQKLKLALEKKGFSNVNILKMPFRFSLVAIGKKN